MQAASVPRILVCPQEFKGSLTAFEATRAIATGARRAAPRATVTELPMADGGPGTAEIVAHATGGEMITCSTRGPLGDTVEARYAYLEHRDAPPLAVVESATAAGLILVPAEERDATLASSFGVGTLLADAIRRGARELIIGVGGTGTNDGGAGLAQALGLRLLDPAGTELPPGGIHLARLARIERPESPPRDLRVRIAVDVQNLLLGAEGATAVYGPQKGLLDWQAPAMETALTRWAERSRRDLNADVTSVSGVGAGGGMPAGILAWHPDATIESGAALVGQVIGLAEQIAAADLVITGEGAFDGQTAYGKAVAHVIEAARASGVPCAVVAGSVQGVPQGGARDVADIEALAPTGDPRALAAAMADASGFAADAAERLVARWIAGR